MIIIASKQTNKIQYHLKILESLGFTGVGGLGGGIILGSNYILM